MSLTSKVKLHFHLLTEVIRFIFFLTSATLIFRGTDISKCFRESLGIRDNESRLYLQFSALAYKILYFNGCSYAKIDGLDSLVAYTCSKFLNFSKYHEFSMIKNNNNIV